MQFQIGDEVIVENGWTRRSSLASRNRRVGTILEVMGEQPRTRYRIRWHNHGGGESIYRPAGETMRRASAVKKPGFTTS